MKCAQEETAKSNHKHGGTRGHRNGFRVCNVRKVWCISKRDPSPHNNSEGSRCSRSHC